MDMFNRLKNTVSSFSTVLPGNPVTREYEVIEHIASSGPGLLWKVYRGIKKSTKEEAAVFVLEKKLLEKYAKHERDNIIEIMKKGVSNLTRLRHPSILTVQHPVEESRESLAFATEPVFASLANILGSQENMPVPPNKMLKNFELYDVEIKYGLLQVVEGLAFLHNDVKMLHRNICPESIMVNKNGAWKLAGFDFCIQSAGQEQHPFPEISFDCPPPSLPNPSYLAPECVLASTCGTSSDMFSFGALIYAVHNKGKSILNNCGSVTSLENSYKQLKHLSPSTFSCLPAEFQEHVKLLLNSTPEIRPDAFQTSKLQMFEDVGVKTLQYLDSLYQWDNLQKSHFYKGLPQIVMKMPKRVNLYRILPCLVKEYCVPEMVPFVLPSVLLIAEDASKEEFQEYILQDMVSLFRLQEPVQIMLIFMQKMELLLKKCPAASINNHVLPMIYRALESDAQQIQELCLSIIPRFAVLVEYSAMKNALIPRIKKLCISTSYLSVRVNCLVCLGKLLEHLDKWLVLDEILPFLPQIPSKEPAVLMGILGIIKLTMSHKKLGITKEIIATKTIPFLMPLSIENGLTLNQFNAIMSVVKEMVARVETEHKAKLEQLNSIRQEQNSTLGMSQMASNTDIFEAFVQGSKQNNQPNDVFKDLGLPSFGSSGSLLASGASVPQKSDFLANSTVTPNAAGDSQKPLSLSLEEKKKLAWEQEQQMNFKSKSSSPLVPSSSQMSFSSSTSASPMSRNSAMHISNSHFPTYTPPELLSKSSVGGTPVSSPPMNSRNSMGDISGSHFQNFSQPKLMQGAMGSPVGSPMLNMYSQPQISQSPQQFQPFQSMPFRPSSLNQMPSPRQNTPPASAKNPDFSSFNDLLPMMGKQTRTLNQISGSSQISSQFQSLNLANQSQWTARAPQPRVTAMSPDQSGPHSLPAFTAAPATSPKNELKDLLG